MINSSESPSHRITKGIPVNFVEFNYKTIRVRAFNKSREERVEKISLSREQRLELQPSIRGQLGGIEKEIELSFQETNSHYKILISDRPTR